MTQVDQKALEDLLRQAAPRPAPSDEATEAARGAVRGEWQTTIGRRRRRRQAAGLAVAATVLIGMFLALDLLRVPTPAPQQVAAIDKSFGPVYVLGEQAEMRLSDITAIVAGQTVVTGERAGLAIAWGGGGSLRLDQNTRVEFADSKSIFLQYGRVYFDSREAAIVAGFDAGDSPAFLLGTPHAAVRHVGTQYMARVTDETLVVSVREGKVEIDGNYFDHQAVRGEQVTLRGRQRPSLLNIAGTGGDWQWIEATTPAVDVDGRSLYEFLTWVSRELGLQLEFEGDAEAVSRAAILRGSIDSRPADALRMRLASAALAWRIDGGTIYVGYEF